jgi:hypothetical protein
VSPSGWSEKRPARKMRVLRHKPSAHCRTLTLSVRAFHPCKTACRHWCVRPIRLRAAPFGPSTGRPARRDFFLSKTGIIPTTSQLPGSERTSSWIQPRDTVKQTFQSLIHKYTHIYKHIHTNTCIYIYICPYTYIYVHFILRRLE